MGVVGDHPVTLVTLGDIKNPLVLLGCLAFVVMIVLEKMKIKAHKGSNSDYSGFFWYNQKNKSRHDCYVSSIETHFRGGSDRNLCV